MDNLEWVKRNYSVNALYPGSWRVKCTKCNQQWSLSLNPELQQGVVTELRDHKLGHEEITRRVRYLRRDIK